MQNFEIIEKLNLANIFSRIGLNTLLKNQAKDLKNYLLVFLNEVLEKLMNNTYVIDNQILKKNIV
ncbi:MAG: hypothetical protein EAZ97_07410 [Bacteroidetes bacterium]|nr:MAG: hypothetical protein EAZ97_07410 [Bacteroidota bacterium]